MAKAKNTDKGAALDIQLKTGCFEDAALVRRAVFMDEQGYENEFDQIDEDPGCIHVTLYVDGQLTGCSRVFPEELERAADAEAPVHRRATWTKASPRGRPTLWGASPCCRLCVVAGCKRDRRGQRYMRTRCRR